MRVLRIRPLSALGSMSRSFVICPRKPPNSWSIVCFSQKGRMFDRNSVSTRCFRSDTHGSMFGRALRGIWRELARRFRGGFADHQLRFYRNLLRPVFQPFETVKQNLGGDFSHALEWLADRGQARRMKHGGLNVVK